MVGNDSGISNGGSVSGGRLPGNIGRGVGSASYILCTTLDNTSTCMGSTLPVLIAYQVPPAVPFRSKTWIRSKYSSAFNAAAVIAPDLNVRLSR